MAIKCTGREGARLADCAAPRLRRDQERALVAIAQNAPAHAVPAARKLVGRGRLDVANRQSFAECDPVWPVGGDRDCR
jgi:hypothetical protein